MLATCCLWVFILSFYMHISCTSLRVCHGYIFIHVYIYIYSAQNFTHKITNSAYMNIHSYTLTHTSQGPRLSVPLRSSVSPTCNSTCKQQNNNTKRSLSHTLRNHSTNSHRTNHSTNNHRTNHSTNNHRTNHSTNNHRTNHSTNNHRTKYRKTTMNAGRIHTHSRASIGTKKHTSTRV